MSHTDSGPVRTTTAAAVPSPRAAAETAPEVAAPAPAAAPGDPGMIGLPSFLVGSVALALVDIGFAPLAASGAAIPIILTATGFGTLVAALWAARLGQNVVAGINGVFAGFWLSYAALSIGLSHRWWAVVLPIATARTVEVFLLAWIVVIGLLVLGTLRLPVAYTALLGLVEATLVISYIATVNLNANLTKVAGWVIVAFCAIGGYLYLSALSTATGGRAYPMGRPILR